MITLRALLAMLMPLFARAPFSTDVEADSWRVWKPEDPPIPEKHPRGHGHACADAHWMQSGQAPIKMCVHDVADPVATSLKVKGRWIDCAMLLRNYNLLADREGPASIFLEVGANIGACTVEFLALTGAHVIAVEPNPINLFHLTRTLSLHPDHERHHYSKGRNRFLHNCHEASQASADLQPCVHVLPIGAGDRPAELKIFTESSNAGNSILEDKTDAGALGLQKHLREIPGQYQESMSSTVQVRRLDDVLPSGLPQNARAFMKVDVQARAATPAL